MTPLKGTKCSWFLSQISPEEESANKPKTFQQVKKDNVRRAFAKSLLPVSNVKYGLQWTARNKWRLRYQIKKESYFSQLAKTQNKRIASHIQKSLKPRFEINSLVS